MNCFDIVVIKDVRGANCVFDINNIEYIQDSVSPDVHSSIGLKSGKEIYISRGTYDKLFKALAEDALVL